MKTWLSIGAKHPGTYFDAYVAQTNGYWYPDISYKVGLADGIYPNEFGLRWQPVIKGTTLTKIKEILFKYLKLINSFFLSANITGILCAMVVGQKEMRLVG